MSSIDKYVIGEARECNPNVRVEKICGRITGYIGTKKVFDIADRYGYLSEDERSIIRESIRAYDEERLERERREQARLENERKIAQAAFRRNVLRARDAITESHQSAMKLFTQTSSTTSASSKLAKLSRFHVSAYAARIREIDEKMIVCKKRMEQDYQTQLSQIKRIEMSVRDDSTTREYIYQASQLQQVRTTIVTANIPVEEIYQLEGELDKLTDVLKKVEIIETDLRKIPNSGMAGAIAQNAIREIGGYEIKSLEDVDRLIMKLQELTAEIKLVVFQNRTQERADQIALLDGIVRACSQLRSYNVEQNYVAESHRNEIVEIAHTVASQYSRLSMADYSTCSKERIEQIINTVQEVLIGTKSDEQTLVTLRRFLDEGERYERDDALQANHYADYKRKTEELINRGYPIEDIDRFDPFHYEEQRQRLNHLLLQQDVEEAISRTTTTFLMACKTMEDMGYNMLYYDMGGDNHEGDALAQEAIYVMPGCEGVVFRLVVSDCNISRKIVGIQRTSGACTTVARVREVAAKIEADGEIEEFFGRYAEAEGGELTVTAAVDTETEGCDAVIEANGCFVLSEEGEAKYDEIVSTGTQQQRNHWQTRVTQNVHSEVVKANEGCSEREAESRQCYDTLKRARAHK